MAQPTHILVRYPRRIDHRHLPPEDFPAYVTRLRRTNRLFGVWTAQPPRRNADLAGNSVYFLFRQTIRFRMPYIRTEPVATFHPLSARMYPNHTAIVCAPCIVPVLETEVPRMRGWRYLAPDDAPRDRGDRDYHTEQNDPLAPALAALGLRNHT